MFLRIDSLKEKKLIGKNLSMSLAENKTFELWQSFMQNRKFITNNIGSDLYSIQVYDNLFFEDFSPTNSFIKWAATEVENYNSIPDTMNEFTLPEGIYAVFLHKGIPSDFPATANYIFNNWMPASDYELDNRPHFEILGEKYLNNNSASEEEVWIPIKKRR
jgi:AraC family transcriptional regulator